MSIAKSHRINNEIRVPQVRLIGRDGENVGVVSIDEANRIAEDAALDLVEIVPNASPPVCRIMDFGKFKFEEGKKASQARKRQKQIEIKEVKFRPTTDEADYQVKMRNLTRFLNEGNKGKVTIRYRGREMSHKELGMDVLQRVENELVEIAVVEQKPKLEGRQMVMVLAPKKQK
ncbi:MAG: translation initiation factor IF-3 [Thiotrichales bacterium]